MIKKPEESSDPCFPLTAFIAGVVSMVTMPVSAVLWDLGQRHFAFAGAVVTVVAITTVYVFIANAR